MKKLARLNSQWIAKLQISNQNSSLQICHDLLKNWYSREPEILDERGNSLDQQPGGIRCDSSATSLITFVDRLRGDRSRKKSRYIDYKIMNRENSHRISVGRNFSFTHLSLTSSREKLLLSEIQKQKVDLFFSVHVGDGIPKLKKSWKKVDNRYCPRLAAYREKKMKLWLESDIDTPY
jgi:hypothetical protein